MTDDVSRGLALLAAEAEPAPIDSHAVIDQARTRTRNRRAMAAAFVAVVAVGAVAMALGPLSSGGNTPAGRLTRQLSAAVPNVIPDRWAPVEPPTTPGNQPQPRVFRCTVPPGSVDEGAGFATNKTCFAEAYYQDGQGTIRLGMAVTLPEPDQGTVDIACFSSCEEHTLPDGTLAQVNANNTDQEHVQTLWASRPGNTFVIITLSWNDTRSAPPLTDDELLKFATVFSR
jgi:hypothetical protein